MAEHQAVLMTAPSAEVAADIARALVGEGLAACVNIVPGVRSIYRWKGEVCDDAEVLCVIKTRAERFEEVRARVVALHPYEVPEVVAVPLVAGNAAYLAWVDSLCRSGE
ncbi:MAG: divalent-cation tolerance protein CutA [Deltaproteobacteria bacterium]|nr:divalent-cation tolerance protein CutA [Deltaproteobacteria bacterium]